MSAADKARARAQELREKQRGSADKPEDLPPLTADGIMDAARGRRTKRQSIDAINRGILHLDPTRVKPWVRANRHTKYMSQEGIRDLAETIWAQGQQIPALVIPADDNDDCDFWLIVGRRRWEAVQLLNLELDQRNKRTKDKREPFPLKAIYADTSNEAELVVLQHTENIHREDLSPWEEGRDYASWLDDSLYDTARNIAEAVGVSEAAVSRRIKVGGIPESFVDALGGPKAVSQTKMLQLAEALNTADRAALERTEAVAKHCAVEGVKGTESLSTMLASLADENAPAALITKPVASRKPIFKAFTVQRSLGNDGKKKVARFTSSKDGGINVRLFVTGDEKTIADGVVEAIMTAIAAGSASALDKDEDA